MRSEQKLIIKIETPIPERIVTGAGTAFYLAGSCFHTAQPIRRVEILFDGQAQSDVAGQTCSSADSDSKNLLNSFWAIIQVQPVAAATSVDLSLRATLLDGEIIQQRIAVLNLTPFETEVSPLPAPVGSFENTPLVAICMTTYNPPLALFRRQIGSIREQTYRNWVCVISDDASEPQHLAELQRIISVDERFMLSQAPQRLGVFRNFERSLMLAPTQARYLALADQDDYWYPQKLQTLLAQFDAKTTLVYSDMRIVNERGEIISETFWTARDNNYRDFASLLLVNTISGAAAIFDGRLRDQLLPFPLPIGALLHDHWIACVARARGEVKYVDLPLYDYVQHGGNVIGYQAAPLNPPHKLYKVIYWMFLEMRTPEGRQRASASYFGSVLPLLVMARVILLRGRSGLESGSRRVLRRIAQLDRSWLSIAWLFLRGLQNWRPRYPALGAEYHLLLGIFWKLYAGFKSRWQKPVQ